MAYHFSANQFEDGYRARRLRNWEVPKWYPEHPRTPLSTTRFIADSRGHLLPGVAKSNPWGNYKGTWDLPNKITKEIAQQITAPPRKLQNVWGKRRAPPHITPQLEESAPPESLPVLTPGADESFLRRNRSSSALDLRTPTPSKLQPLEPLPTAQPVSSPKIPAGSLDENVKNVLEEVAEEEVKDYEPTLCRAIDCLQDADKREKYLEDKVPEKIEEMVATKKDKGPPLMNDYSPSQIAKRFHDENLKHSPLPDVVDDPVFKALSSSKDPFPGRGLDIEPTAAAIGWRASGAGPTKCSKARVYRPKTAVSKEKSNKSESRPKTSEPHKDKRFGPIDLAICWDLAPNEKIKRTVHIDGSGGGEAPSVFTVIKRQDDNEVGVAGSFQAVATHVAPCVEEDNVGTLPPKIGEKLASPPKRVTNRGAIMTQVKPVLDSPQDSFHSLSPQSAIIAKNNPKTAWTDHDTSKVLSEKLEKIQGNSTPSRKCSQSTIHSTPLSRQRHHQSTPNLTSASERSKKENGSTYSVDAMPDFSKKICEGSNCGTDSTTDKKKELKEYKMAFKAGVPNNNIPPAQGKPVKMPKMRPPYSKKNYSISTLIPPFSLWPDHHGQEYPEHWRLASVYQHSFKPVDCRRKPLLASVYQ